LDMATHLRDFEPLQITQGRGRTQNGLRNGIIGGNSGRSYQFNLLVNVIACHRDSPCELKQCCEQVPGLAAYIAASRGGYEKGLGPKLASSSSTTTSSYVPSGEHYVQTKKSHFWKAGCRAGRWCGQPRVF